LAARAGVEVVFEFDEPAPIAEARATASAASGARPGFVCRMTPVALITRPATVRATACDRASRSSELLRRLLIQARPCRRASAARARCLCCVVRPVTTSRPCRRSPPERVALQQFVDRGITRSDDMEGGPLVAASERTG
jgi:hypothetical protein